MDLSGRKTPTINYRRLFKPYVSDIKSLAPSINIAPRRVCPACRGYALESSWCGLCKGEGMIIQTRSTNQNELIPRKKQK